jgi:hypothetical protein
MTSGYYRTSSPVTALPMIMRWISDVPSKIVKLMEVRAVSAGRWPGRRSLVSTNSAPHAGRNRPHGFVRGTAAITRRRAGPPRRGWSAFESACVDDDAAPVRLELKGRRRFHLQGRRRGLAHLVSERRHRFHDGAERGWHSIGPAGRFLVRVDCKARSLEQRGRSRAQGPRREQVSLRLAQGPPRMRRTPAARPGAGCDKPRGTPWLCRGRTGWRRR